MREFVQMLARIDKQAVREFVRTLARSDKPGRLLASRVLWLTGLGRALRMTTRHPEGFRLSFHPAPMSANVWLDKGNVYTHDLRFFKSRLRPGDVVVDVGANIGLLTLGAATYVGHSGRVFSFEPHPRVFSYLKENVELNQLENVELFQCALGPSEGRTWLTDQRADDQNFVATHGVEVPLRVLDECVPADVGISLLKLDVEGYEKFVLEGAADTLARTECIYFEALDFLCARYGYTVSELLQMVTNAGFDVRPEPPDTTTPKNYVATR